MSAARAARVAARAFGDLVATLPRQACNNEGKGPLFFLTLNCKPKVLFVDMTRRTDVGLDLYTGKMVTPEAGVIEPQTLAASQASHLLQNWLIPAGLKPEA